MKGRFVALRLPIDDDDYAAIADWVRPLSPSAVLAGDSEVLSPGEIRQLNQQGTVRHFLVDSVDGRCIGVVSWRPVGTPGGYSIGSAVGDPQLWSQGYGAEATALLVDYLFHVRNAHRVQVMTALFNKHSVHVMTRGHFVLEGILRRYYYLDGEYHDAAIWSILREEFYAGVAAAKAVSAELDVQDLVPAADKAEARRMLTRYLRQGRPSSFAGYAGADAPGGPAGAGGDAAGAERTTAVLEVVS